MMAVSFQAQKSNTSVSVGIMLFILDSIEIALRILRYLPVSVVRRKLKSLNYRVRNRMWSIIIKGDHKSVRIKRGEVFWTFPAVEGPINKAVFVDSEYNDTEIDILMEFIKSDDRISQIVREKKVCLDIGANIGTSAIPLAKCGFFSKIYAIEPDPVNHMYLSENVKINRLDRDIEIHRLALSDRTGVVDFEISPDNCGDHRVVSEATNFDLNELSENNRSITQVPCMTLDTFLSSQKLEISDIGLIWSDTQGHEGHILGLSTLLGKHPIPIYCEFWPYGLKRSGGLDLFVKLVERRYSFYVDFFSPTPTVESTTTFGRMTDHLTGIQHTNILLF